MTQTKRPAPPVLKRQGFTLRNDCFGVEGQERVEEKSLLEYFFPQLCKDKEGQRLARVEAGYAFSKPFFEAQLRYYGIEFPANAQKAALGKILKEAVVTGKVNSAFSRDYRCY